MFKAAFVILALTNLLSAILNGINGSVGICAFNSFAFGLMLGYLLKYLEGQHE